MKPQPETSPVLHQELHEMLMRLLKVAELLNRGQHDQQAANIFAGQKSSERISVKKGAKNHSRQTSCNLLF
jgi:hypothetical protein